MKFDSTAIPILPTEQELNELNDLLLSATELFKMYATLERHPRITPAPKAVELFTACREQLHQDIVLLDKQLETLLALARGRTSTDKKLGESQAIFAQGDDSGGQFQLPLIPDVEPTDIKQSVFEIMRQAFHTEDLFSDQLNSCLLSAQGRKHLKLELQIKMIILSADQRNSLLEERYGFARTKNALFQGLRRQTTRFLSALSGESRPDIDR